MTPIYFANLHDEALTLLVESRNYIKQLREQEDGRRGPRSSRSPTAYLDLSLETMRLTSRLTQVMAWMLAQRAVMAGEITADEANSDKFRLLGQSVCLEHDPTVLAAVPSALSGLLQRSYDLYRRIERLEAQIGDRLAEAANENGRPVERPSRGLRLMPVATTSDQSPQTSY
jgi:regulator of CtrA degradation